MANSDTPFGLKPKKHLNGNPWNGKFEIYYVTSTNGTALYLGDPVIAEGSADATGLYPTITQAVAGSTTNLGVIVGFGDDPQLMAQKSNLNRDYRPASTAMYVAVVDDPDVIFEVQEDSVGAAIAATGVLTHYDLIIGSGSTTTGLSGVEIDSSTGSILSRSMKLLRLVNRSDNALGTNAKWEVIFVEHAHRGTGASGT